MLKIKDNVDLKELEKLGFYFDSVGDSDKYYYSKTIYEGRRGQSFDITIYSKNREVMGWANGADGDGQENHIDNTLYDLIKADLVEKIEER